MQIHFFKFLCPLTKTSYSLPVVHITMFVVCRNCEFCILDDIKSFRGSMKDSINKVEDCIFD